MWDMILEDGLTSQLKIVTSDSQDNPLPRRGNALIIEPCPSPSSTKYSLSRIFRCARKGTQTCDNSRNLLVRIEHQNTTRVLVLFI